MYIYSLPFQITYLNTTLKSELPPTLCIQARPMHKHMPILRAHTRPADIPTPSSKDSSLEWLRDFRYKSNYLGIPLSHVVSDCVALFSDSLSVPFQYLKLRERFDNACFSWLTLALPTCCTVLSGSNLHELWENCVWISCYSNKLEIIPCVQVFPHLAPRVVPIVCGVEGMCVYIYTRNIQKENYMMDKLEMWWVDSVPK